ncbi:MAG: glycoside hydrolase family 127 protein [Salinivirgaceae bacterium]
MKTTILFLLVIAVTGCVKKQSNYNEYPISALPIKDVVINDSFWLPKIKTIQDSTIPYSFNKCNSEGRMESFLIAGGKKEGKVCGKMPFDDTDLYKIIEGASYSLISNPNPALDYYLDSIISIIKIGQEPDGYLTTWFTIDRQNPPASWVKPSKSRWENEISSHELYNSGHLFEAASAHYLATGKRTFLDIALLNADLLVANFGPEKLTRPPGHQIVETGLIKLYQITNKTEYLELAKYFLDVRGDSTTHNLYGAYNQDHLPVVMQEEVVGHAVRGVYMYAGMTDIAAIYSDTAYRKAVNKLWDNMVNKKMYITGGIGARHDGEAFGENYELPNLTAYNETCAAIGSVYWNQRLFQLTGDSKYYDIIERTLYNGLIAGISLNGNKFFYPNPLESDGKYLFNMGACTRQSWFDCSCCPTNLIRFLPSIPSLIYATNKDSLYVNLFISNQTHVVINENRVEVNQETGYPWNGKIKIAVNPEKPTTFTLKVRIPGWAQNKAVPGILYAYLDAKTDKFVLSVNGKEMLPTVTKGFIEITKEWHVGDSVELDLPMTIRKVIANDMVADDSNKVAIEYGPIVYCAEEIDNPSFLPISISDNAILKIGEKTVLSENINEIEVSTTGKELRLVPYYLWSNRGIGKMQVWFARLH